MNDFELNEDIHQYPIVPKKTSYYNFDEKIVVYTCIVGNNDVLREVVKPEAGIDYVCFTNQNFSSSTWKVIPIPEILAGISDSTKVARCIKILPHIFFSEYTISVWVDGNIEVIGNIVEFIYKNLKNYFLVSKHPQRNCVYAEAEAIVKLGKDTKENVDKQISIYKQNGYPSRYGMVQTDILVRRHMTNLCIKISENWWKEVFNFSKRDQLSFNYSIWKTDVQIDIMHPKIIVSDHFQKWQHVNNGCDKAKISKNYGNILNFINGVPV